MRSLSAIGRVAAVGAVIAAIVLVGIVLFGGAGAGGYKVKARFINAGQIVKGNPVQVGGVPVGSVNGIKITDDGQAEIKISIDGDHAPLRRGTRAAIRQFSQSGIANRYIDLKLPPHTDDGDPRRRRDRHRQDRHPGRPRPALQHARPGDPELAPGLLQGLRRPVARHGRRGQRRLRVPQPGAVHLQPALQRADARTSRCSSASSWTAPRLVTALAERRDDLAALIGNLNETTRALGSQKEALAESIERLPPFMRRANTTFVNLRAALDDVDPLVEASKPVAKRLEPFLSQARAFAADAEPTVARPAASRSARAGPGERPVDLMRDVPAAGGHRHGHEAAQRARPAAALHGRRDAAARSRRRVEALKGGAGEIGFARPYTTDFLGWFDDFSTTGGGFDALGATARGMVSFATASCTRTRSAQQAVQALPGRRRGARRRRLERALGRGARAPRLRRGRQGGAAMRRLLVVLAVLGVCAGGVRARRAPRTEVGRRADLQDRLRQRLRPDRGRRLPRGRRDRRPDHELRGHKKPGEPPKADVTAEITKPGFGDFRKDATCNIKPQSLIGEYYVDCQPGTSTQKLPDGGAVPVEQTASTIPRTSSTTSCAAPTASACG